MYKVIIRSQGINEEIEWEQEISANTSRGARRKATNWIKKNLCQSDYTEIEKHEAGTKDFWWVL